MQTNREPQFLAARPGQTLFCTWLPNERALRSLRLTLRLLERHLPLGTAYGYEVWPNGVQRILFVAWADDGARAVLRHAYRMYGDAIDWGGVLPVSGQWTTLHGVPRIVDREYDAAVEAAVSVPAWLARLQLPMPAEVQS